MPDDGEEVRLRVDVAAGGVAGIPVVRAAHLHGAGACDHVPGRVQGLKLDVGVPKALLTDDEVLRRECVVEAQIIFTCGIRLAFAAIIEDVVIEVGVRRDLRR